MSENRLPDELLTALRRGERPARFPRDEIRRRVLARVKPEASPARRSSTPGFWVWATGSAVAVAVAAALLIFVLGAEYGRRSHSLPPQPPSASGPAESGSVPGLIQEQGTAFVAAVTRFSEAAGSLSSYEQEQARQVALAVLYGAALELRRHAPGDPVAAAIYDSIAREREQDRERAEAAAHLSF